MSYCQIAVVLSILFWFSSSTLAVSREWQPGDLLIRESDTLKSSQKLTSQQIAEDLSQLSFALLSGYGGRNYVPKTLFQDTLTSFGSVPGEFQQGGSGEAICRWIAEKLEQIPDSHLGATVGDHNCSPKFSLEGGVGKNINADNQKVPWRLIWEGAHQKKVAVLSLSSMWETENPAWTGLLDSVRDIKRKADVLVIDLRGNHGGSDIVPAEVARILYGGDFPTPVAEIVKSKTAASLAIRVNSYEYKIRKLREKSQPIPEYLEKKLAAAKAEYALALAGKLPPLEIQKKESPTSPPSQGGFGKPIYILVDRVCASACESMLQFLEAYPNLALAGEHTDGAIHFGNVGKTVLHNSQITIGIATDFWKFKDGRFWEKRGYIPTIPVSSGGDALKTVLDLIQASKS